MRKIYSSLLVLAMLLVGTVAKAQYTVVIESDPIEGYVAGQQSFDAAEIAQALGLADAAALKTLVDENDAVYLGIAEGKSNAYTGNHNEFWMNLAGEPQGYSADGTSWFAGIEVEAAGTDEETGETWNDRVNVYVGQMPGVFKKIYEASELKAMLYLISGEKEVSFDVTQKVTAASAPSLPEPTKSFAELEVVKEYTVTLEYTQGSQYEGKTAEVDMSDIYEALGTDAASLNGAIDDYVVSRVMSYDAETETNTLSDDLVVSRFGTDGWFGRYTMYDESTGEETFLKQNYIRQYGGDCTFYFQNPTLEDGKFTFTNGQYPGTMKAGDEDYAEVFIVNGTKAAKLTLKVNIKKPESIDFSEMEMAGEEEIVVEIDADDTGATEITIDLEKIAAILGVEATDLNAAGMNSLADEETLVNGATAHTANNLGFWYNIDGYVAGYASGAMYIEPVNSGDISALNVGKYTKTAIEQGKSLTVSLYFLGITTYYKVNVTLKVKAEEEQNDIVDISDLKIVETLSYNVQLIQAEMYSQDEKTQVNWEQVLKSLDAESVGKKDIYTWSKEEESWVPESLTNDYTCTPAPGFWMSEDGKTNSSWSSSCAYGVTVNVSSGEVSWYVHEASTHVAGETYTCKLYVVNWQNGNVVQLVFNISYVDERVEIETVGEEDFAIVMTEDKLNENDFYAESVSLAAAFEALGISEDEYDACVWYVLGTNGAFISPEEVFNDADAGSSFNALGGNVSSEAEDAVFTVGMDDYNSSEGEYYFFAGMLNGDPEVGKAYSTKAALRYEGKQYVFTIVIGDSEDAVGINTVSENVKSNKVYDLSGRQVKNPAKGLYIMNGKTYFVK